MPEWSEWKPKFLAPGVRESSGTMRTGSLMIPARFLVSVNYKDLRKQLTSLGREYNFSQKYKILSWNFWNLRCRHSSNRSLRPFRYSEGSPSSLTQISFINVWFGWPRTAASSEGLFKPAIGMPKPTSPHQELNIMATSVSAWYKFPCPRDLGSDRMRHYYYVNKILL